ncbi:MAG: hypothetical protein JO257_27585 [Deltaproteobacteria bacterium]|nr:hypothetical protein [Deltaproteobacteria bacterium]
MPAKFNLLIAASIPAVALIPLLACGGDTKKTDGGLVIHDSPGSGGSGSNVTCKFNATFTPTFTAAGEGYTAGSGTTPINRLDFDGLFGGTNGSANEQVLRVLIFGGGGGSSTPDWPTNFAPKQNIDLAGSNAANDVLIALLTDRGATSYGTIYFADSGTLNISAAQNGSGHPFTGSATNVVFNHYDISGNNITPDPDGCSSTVPSFSFTGTTMFDGKFINVGDGLDDAAVLNYLHHRTR